MKAEFNLLQSICVKNKILRHLGPYSLNLLYSKEPLKIKDFLYFLPLPLFMYSLNFPQTKEPNFLSLTFKETLKM